MAEKIIKVRLFTWFEETDSPVQPDQKVLTERIATHGQEVDITNPVYVKRGEDLDAFYTDEEAEQIRNGTYRGADRMILAAARSGAKPVSPVQDIEGEGPVDLDSLSVEELADYISERNLSPSETIALAGGDEDSIEKVLEAEEIATNNEPRDDVVNTLEERLTAASQGRGANAGPSIDATDAAIKLAEEQGVDLRKVHGSGDGGRITKDDVKSFIDKS